MPAAKPTQALIERTLSAWSNLGLPIGSLEVRNDGTVRIFAPEASPNNHEIQKEVLLCDAAFGVVR